jgi:hypothetical protein
MIDEREVIPAGRQPGIGYKHLFPIAKFLIEQRGHMAMEEPEAFGFIYENGSGYHCALTRSITGEDWAALNVRFVVPDNIVYIFGRIRDQANGIEIAGYDTIVDIDGEIPIEVWEERQRAAQ